MDEGILAVDVGATKLAAALVTQKGVVEKYRSDKFSRHRPPYSFHQALKARAYARNSATTTDI